MGKGRELLVCARQCWCGGRGWPLSSQALGTREGTGPTPEVTGMPSPSLVLTAGTSGPPARNLPQRSQSEATGSEAASAPASPWWPQPAHGDRRGGQRGWV